MNYYYKTEQRELTDREFEIVIGKDDYSILIVKMSFSGDHISFTHDNYDCRVMNDEEGQDRANDYLDDDFFKGEWKYAVEQDHTEKSYEDFKQEYVDNHDWLEILGDIKDITINGDTYYTQLTSCGCLMEYTFKDMTKTQLTKDEIETIANADKLLHLKPISEISGHTPLENLLKQVTEIFMKYNIEDWDLEVGKFTDKWEELENNGEIEN